MFHSFGRHWGRRVVVASLRPPCCRRVIAAASVPPSCGQRPVAGAWVLSPLLPPSRCRRSLHAAPVPPRCLWPCGLRLVVAAFLPPPHCILPDAAVPWLPFHWPAMAGFGHWTPKYDNKLKAVCVQEDTLLSRSASRGCSFFWWRFRDCNDYANYSFLLNGTLVACPGSRHITFVIELGRQCLLSVHMAKNQIGKQPLRNPPPNWGRMAGLRGYVQRELYEGVGSWLGGGFLCGGW